MARKYDHEYKVQAVKLAKEIGQAKAAKEQGIPKNTMYSWVRANRLGTLDLGAGSQTPQSAMTLKRGTPKASPAGKGTGERKPTFEERKRLSGGSQRFFRRQPSEVSKKPENDLSGSEDRGRQDYRKNLVLLQNAWNQPPGLL